MKAGINDIYNHDGNQNNSFILETQTQILLPLGAKEPPFCFILARGSRVDGRLPHLVGLAIPSGLAIP